MSKYQFTLISFYQVNTADFGKDIVRNIVFINLLEKWKNFVGKGKVFGALLTDPSKAFDCLDYELLTAKLNAYGFTLTALRFRTAYQTENKTKIDDNYSSWPKILFGLLQGSIRGPLLFNIFLVDQFFVLKDIDITSYADDSTPFIVANNTDNVIASSEQVSGALFNWLKNYRLKNNVDKCHGLVSTRKLLDVKIGDYTIDSSECEKLLGVKVDVHLKF